MSEPSVGEAEVSEMSELPCKVEQRIWKYMLKSGKYGDSVKKVQDARHVTVVYDEEQGGQLVIRGQQPNDIEGAQNEISLLIAHCQENTHAEILDYADKPETLCRFEQIKGALETSAYVAVIDGKVHLLGTDDELTRAMQEIDEKCKDTKPTNEDNQAMDAPEMKPEEILSRSDGAAAAESMPLSDDSVDSDHENVVLVDHNLWKYMLKNKNYMGDIRKLKEDMHVDVVEKHQQDVVSPTSVHLLISGPETDVAAAVSFAHDLVDRCRQNTETQHIPCHDNRIFSKILKLLNTVNKSQGYVEAADEMVFVTGSLSEIAECRDKLTKLGLVISKQESPPVDKPVESFAADAGKKSETPSKVPPRDSDRGDLPSFDASVFNPGATDDFGVGSFGGNTSTEMPVERALWLFIEKRRSEKLQELRTVYGVRVVSYPGQDNIVMLRFEADSPDMLDISRDALFQLMEQLQKSIVTTGLDTQTELPRELCDRLVQQVQNTDAVVDFVGSKIHIIGTAQGAGECQQQIVGLLQQLSAQSQQLSQNPAALAELQSRYGGGRGMSDGGMMRMMGSQGFGGPRSLPGTMGGPGGSGTAGMPRMMMGPPGAGGGAMGRAGGMTGMMGSAGGMSDMMGPGSMPEMMNELGGMPGLMGNRNGGMTGGMSGSTYGNTSMYQTSNSMPDSDMFGGPSSMRDSSNSRISRPDNAFQQLANPAVGRSGDLPGSDHQADMLPSMYDDEDVDEEEMGFLDVVTGKREAADLVAEMIEKQDRQSKVEGSQPVVNDATSELKVPGTRKNTNVRNVDSGGEVEEQAVKSTRDNAKTLADCGREPTTKQVVEPRISATDSTPKDTKSNVCCSSEACTVCQTGPHHFSVGKKCPHAFCTTCIQAYFSRGESECPVCGVQNDVVGHKSTQPSNGRMLTTYDNKVKLPGFDSTSSGMIVVTYCFPAGVQTVLAVGPASPGQCPVIREQEMEFNVRESNNQEDDMPNPGLRYASLTKTAFLPLSSDGNRVVELLQQAFDARLLFTVKPGVNGLDGELVLNGICHKTAIFGGPQQNGYPDPVYMRRILNELRARGLQ